MVPRCLGRSERQGIEHQRLEDAVKRVGVLAARSTPHRQGKEMADQLGEKPGVPRRLWGSRQEAREGRDLVPLEQPW